MRTLFLSTATCFVLSAVNAQTTVLSEDFQDGLPGTWTVVIQDTHTVNATVSEFAPGWIALQDPDNPSDTIVGATSYFVTPGTSDRWLISPPMTLGAYGNSLTWQARSHDPSYPDSYHVLVSVTDANPASFTDTLKSVATENDLWTTHTVNLSDTSFHLENQTIHVAFVLRSIDKFKLYVDDFMVSKDDPAGAGENNLPVVDVYPNPTNGQLVFKGNVTSVTITSTDGTKVIEQAISSGAPVDLSHLAPGNYFAVVFTPNGLVHKKIVKL